MTSHAPPRFRRGTSVRHWARCATLVAILLVTCAGVLPAAYYIGGAMGVWSATVAASVCMLGAMAGLITEPLFAPAVGGMLLRMAVPLVVLLIAYGQRSVFAQTGLVYYMLVFYMVTLSVETWMSLPHSARWRVLSEDQ